MFRRSAAVICSVALVLALVVAALHNHDGATQQSASSDAACLYCSGGIAPTRAPVIIPAVERVWAAAEQAAPVPPHLKRTIPLAHSGNAPPA